MNPFRTDKMPHGTLRAERGTWSPPVHSCRKRGETEAQSEAVIQPGSLGDLEALWRLPCRTREGPGGGILTSPGPGGSSPQAGCAAALHHGKTRPQPRCSPLCRRRGPRAGPGGQHPPCRVPLPSPVPSCHLQAPTAASLPPMARCTVLVPPARPAPSGPTSPPSECGFTCPCKSETPGDARPSEIPTPAVVLQTEFWIFPLNRVVDVRASSARAAHLAPLLHRARRTSPAPLDRDTCRVSVPTVPSPALQCPHTGACDFLSRRGGLAVSQGHR